MPPEKRMQLTSRTDGYEVNKAYFCMFETIF